jgi:Probable cobalt transporter subunit (CbtB)
MSDLALQRDDPPALAHAPVVPLRDLVPWAVLAGAVLLVLLYVVGLDEGATSVVPGRYVHELLHDGRHLLAFPCH